MPTSLLITTTKTSYTVIVHGPIIVSATPRASPPAPAQRVAPPPGVAYTENVLPVSGRWGGTSDDKRPK
jgi:hypothetical protein